MPDDESDLLRVYLEDIARYPMLTRDEERRLAREAAAGDDEARSTLVTSNLRLVVALAKRYRATGVPLLDLIQQGNEGLVLASDKYDPDKGFAFSTYATWWIRQSLARLARDSAGTAALDRVQHAWDELVARNGRGAQPSLAELAEAAGMTVEEVADVLGAPPPEDDPRG